MASKRQRSISCSDEDWAEIGRRAKASGSSVSEYLVIRAKSDADNVTAKNANFSEIERSAFRAIWFLYTDRLSALKAAGDQQQIDALVEEARRKFE